MRKIFLKNETLFLTAIF